MGRVSRTQAQENRRRVVETASRLLREQGTAVSVADLMKAAGLTHGGFYKQFASKEALVGEATAHAFEDLARQHAETRARHEADPAELREAVVDAYLSAAHRDAPATGCPVAALATDMAREPGNAEAHRIYAEGAAAFAAFLGTDDEDGLTRLCTMIGALTLARATKNTALSDQILAAARNSLNGPRDQEGDPTPGS
ncbi:TetR family transcriptional regulator [Spirillospora sp. NPDC046719]